jgi:hypothetical protein
MKKIIISTIVIGLLLTISTIQICATSIEFQNKDLDEEILSNGDYIYVTFYVTNESGMPIKNAVVVIYEFFAMFYPPKIINTFLTGSDGKTGEIKLWKPTPHFGYYGARVSKPGYMRKYVDFASSRLIQVTLEKIFENSEYNQQSLEEFQLENNMEELQLKSQLLQS